MNLTVGTESQSAGGGSDGRLVTDMFLSGPHSTKLYKDYDRDVVPKWY